MEIIPSKVKVKSLTHDNIASHGCNQLIAEETADIWIPWTTSQWKPENTTE